MPLKIEKKIVGWEVDKGQEPPAPLIPKQERPYKLPGTTYRIKGGEMPHSLYVTITDIEVEGHKVPFEIFVNSRDMSHFQWSVGLTRMASAFLRSGGSAEVVIEELRCVQDPSGGIWWNRKLRPSLVAIIGDVLAEHVRGPTMPQEHGPETGLATCPQCGEKALQKASGCENCTKCDYSKCG